MTSAFAYEGAIVEVERDLPLDKDVVLLRVHERQGIGQPLKSHTYLLPTALADGIGKALVETAARRDSS